MSLSRKAFYVKVIDVITNKEEIFSSNVKAAEFLDVSEWTIRAYKVKNFIIIDIKI